MSNVVEPGQTWLLKPKYVAYERDKMHAILVLRYWKRNGVNDSIWKVLLADGTVFSLSSFLIHSYYDELPNA